MMNYNDLKSEEIIRYAVKKYPKKDARLDSISKEDKKLHTILEERNLFKLIRFADTNLIKIYDESKEVINKYGMNDLVDFLRHKTSELSREYVERGFGEANKYIKRLEKNVLDGLAKNGKDTIAMGIKRLLSSEDNSYNNSSIDSYHRIAQDLIDSTKNSEDALLKDVNNAVTSYAHILSKLRLGI